MMDHHKSMQAVPRVLFFGMPGSFSAPVLAALLAAEIEVCAVVIPAPLLPGRASPAIQRRDPPRVIRAPLPLANASLHASIIETAWQRQIPVWEVRRLANPLTISTLAAYRPDLSCVACFSRLLPRVMFELPRLGSLNVHPALLPANRGPAPLFWTLREGQQTTGVTIHQIDEGIDSGDILAQTSIELPDGIGYGLLERQCAILGGTLLAHTVWDIWAGRAKSIPQDEASSSYYPSPTEEDFVVRPGEWSARHVYNFICGVSAVWGPVSIELDGKHWLVRKALSYSQEQSSAYRNSIEENGELIIPCRDGHVVLSGVADIS